MRLANVLLLGAIAIGCSVQLARSDFGQAIVNEAVDLSTFAEHSHDEGDPRSMEDLLHWAISHSDPDKLAAQAEETQRIQMVKDLKEQRRRVKELLDHVRAQPTEADMMKEGIAILRRPSASDTELLAALQALQVLVEPMDNANDLRPLGGIAPVVSQLTRGSELAAAAAHVLGTAASNNPTFQRALLSEHPHVVATLLQVSLSPDAECGAKGMYALAALVRNLAEARRAFVDAGGFNSLEQLLRGADVAPRLRRKALSLFMDLVDTQPAAPPAPEAGAAGPAGAQAADATASGGVGAGHFTRIHLGGGGAATAGEASAPDGSSDGDGGRALTAAALGSGLPEAVVSLLLQGDADMQEKALLVVQRLAADAVAANVLLSHGADEAIAALQQQLRAEAPQPGDEPDPYHDYLLDLAQRVAALLATAQQQHQQHHQQPAASSTGARGPSDGTTRGGEGTAGVEAGAAGPSGEGGREAGRLRQERGGEAGAQEVLALGGPVRSRRVVPEAECGSEAGAAGRGVEGSGQGECRLPSA